MPPPPTSFYQKLAHCEPFRTWQVHSCWSLYSREPCDRLCKGNSDWQTARLSHQVDQGVHSYP